MEKKSIAIELKDFNPGQRTAVLAHAVYDVIDRGGDIARKGMFNKSWQEFKNIDFLFNHEVKSVVGTVQRTFEDDQKAYTEVKFGNWTLGNDALEMADSGVIRGVSFGYVAQKKNYINVKGRKVRELKEVFHAETSILTEFPMNPLAQVVSVTKSMEGFVAEFKAHIENMEKFIRNAKASDETIKKVIEDVLEAKSILDKYDTADTHLADEQPASVEETKDASNEVLTRIKLLTLSI